jgi:predicted nuclease with TOPRIM domain
MKVLYCIALLIGWSSAEKEKGIQELFELVSSLRSEIVALRQLPATSTSSPIQPQKLPTQELGDLQKEVSSLRSENVALRQLTQRYENEQIQLKKKISLCRDWERLDENKLIKQCARNDLAYVEAQVKKFGKEAVLAAKKLGQQLLL